MEDIYDSIKEASQNFSEQSLKDIETRLIPYEPKVEEPCEIVVPLVPLVPLPAREEGLTVAIPTIDSWRGFLRGQISVYLDHPAVSYVILCDETGNDIIDMYEENIIDHPKLRVYQNDILLGAYENKRQCFMRAPTKWVAILDPSNLFDPEFFDSFLSCIRRNGELNKMVYCGGVTERFLPITASTETRTDHFNGMKVSQDNWNNILQVREWDILLNGGNCIWPTKIIKHILSLPKDLSDGVENIFLIQMAIKAGYTLSIEPTMQYVYTVLEETPRLQRADWLL